MTRWFRLYDDIINDPKILLLPENLRWIWIALLCIASKNDGVLPDINVVALSLRVKPPRAAGYITQLVRAGLLDNEDGRFVPHNWSARQFRSDSSTERVRRFRNSKRNVSSNVSETPPESETETDVDDGGDARAGAPGAATPAAAKISTEAIATADAMAAACGFPDPKNCPLGWYGAAAWVQRCLNEGWPAVVMVEATKITAMRKRDGPIEHFKYLEKPLAKAVAEHSRPLPKIDPHVQATDATQPSLRLLRPIQGKGGGYARIAAKLRAGSTSGE